MSERAGAEVPTSNEPRVSPPLILALVVLGIAMAFAVPSLLNARQRGAQKRTMGAMRTLATAMESYSIDHLRYPAGSGDASVLETTLEPTYVKRMPMLDGWGRPLLVVSDGKQYTITSYGKDRSEGGPPAKLNGGTTSFDNDIVFATGSFVQFPSGTMQ